MDEKNTVDQNEVEEAAAAPEEHGFHEVGTADDGVVARSSGDYEASNDLVSWNKVSPAESTKYEGAARPLQSPLETVPVPERHEHSAYDEEGRDKTVDDADFDADGNQEVNKDGSS
jgi:hypothetical protein